MPAQIIQLLRIVGRYVNPRGRPRNHNLLSITLTPIKTLKSEESFAVIRCPLSVGQSKRRSRRATCKNTASFAYSTSSGLPPSLKLRQTGRRAKEDRRQHKVSQQLSVNSERIVKDVLKKGDRSQNTEDSNRSIEQYYLLKDEFLLPSCSPAGSSEAA